MSLNDNAEGVCGGRESESMLAAGNRNCAEVTTHGQYPIADLVDHNKVMRSEIAILDKLIAEKYDELAQLERDELVQCDREHQPAPASMLATSALSGDAHLPEDVRRLKEVVRTIAELDEFTGADGLNEDVIDEYIHHLERNYDQVLIFGPEAVDALNALPKEALKEWLEARRAHDFEKVLFVLKQEGHYSLVLFNGANASFYHYDAANKRHSELAEQLILKLRRHFEAEQLVEVESNAQFGDSSLFTVDSMMKIILTAEDENKESVSPVQVLNLPSQPDYLKIIIMSRYIVTKLSQIEQTIRGSA